MHFASLYTHEVSILGTGRVADISDAYVQWIKSMKGERSDSEHRERELAVPGTSSFQLKASDDDSCDDLRERRSHWNGKSDAPTPKRPPMQDVLSKSARVIFERVFENIFGVILGRYGCPFM